MSLSEVSVTVESIAADADPSGLSELSVYQDYPDEDDEMSFPIHKTPEKR